ncbi:STAS domain-containing protein [Sporosarcina siberiensis]|uniref:STAS domain-containing protein n=1 Tax=Sporosarcina siberiensis TaxID=1365606 RepID=A0ABW4SFW2_9BACL
MFLVQFSRKIIEQAPQLAHVITESQNERYSILKKIENELYPSRIELIKLYANSLIMDEEVRIPELKDWGEKAGSEFAKHSSVTMDMMLREVPSYRNIIGTVLKYDAIEYGIGASEMYDIVTRLDSAVNDITYFLSLPFVRHESERLKLSKSIITELSVPIVSIDDVTAILPLIGTIDHERSLTLQERVLLDASEMQLETLIIDLSGLQTTDTFVVQQLFHLFDALSLLGIQPIVSGISPVIAQTLVSLDLNFGQINSFASMKQALAYIK